MTEEQTSSAPQVADASTGGSKKSKKGPILAIIIVLIIVGAIVVYMMQRTPDTGSTDTTAQQGDTTNVQRDSQVVARVNGFEITLDQVSARARGLVAVSQVDPEQASDSQFQLNTMQQALQLLINDTLLAQAAVANGVTLTEEEITDRVTQVAGRFETDEAFQQALSEQGFTEGQYRNSIAQQILIEKYITQETTPNDIEITEEEVEERYNELSETNEDLGELDEVYDAIEQQLLQEEGSRRFQELLNRLAEEGSIEIVQS